MNYTIAICELHHPSIHGIDNNSTPGIDGHYIASYVIEPEDFMNDIEDCVGVASSMRNDYNRRRLYNHDKIRNYKKIVERPEYLQPQLVYLIELEPGNECVAIIKTHLIVRIQRRWRAFVAKRKLIIQKRMRTRAIAIRERTGLWPLGLRELPRLCMMKKFAL